jgi:hypothetical protein
MSIDRCTTGFAASAFGIAPNKVGCGTATPNGSTVGQAVQNGRAQLQAVIDRQNALAAAGGDVNPFALASAFFSIVKPNGPIDFKKGQSGQTFVQMGLAGNFAYYAIGAGYFSPSTLDAGAEHFGDG